MRKLGEELFVAMISLKQVSTRHSTLNHVSIGTKCQSKHRTSGKSKQFTAAMVVDFGVTKHVCRRTRGGGYRDFI